MRIFAVASIATVALGVAAAQTSSITSTSTTPSPVTVPISAGSRPSSMTTKTGSVSCVFRYAMPTATNIPLRMAPPAPLPSSALVDQENTSQDDSKGAGLKTGSSREDGSEHGLGMVDVGLDSVSSSNTTDVGPSVAKTNTSSSPVLDTATSKTPTTTIKTPVALTTPKPTSTTTENLTATTTENLSSTTTENSTENPTSKTPPATVLGLDGSMATSPATTKLSSGSDGGRRRLMSDVEEVTTSLAATEVSSDGSASPPVNTTTPPLTTKSTPSLTTTTPSSLTTTTPSMTAKSTTTTPSSLTTTTPTPLLTTKNPAMTSKAWNTTDPAMKTETDMSSTSKTSDAENITTTFTTIEFSCDATFYSAWTMMGLTCEGTELDIVSAVDSTECLIYSGTSSGTDILDLATCMSICRFPACTNGIWDYASNEGINSAIYANLNFIGFMRFAGSEAAEAVADSIQQPFSNLTFAATTECDYASDNSFSNCQCADVTPSSNPASSPTNSKSHYAVPFDKGLEDSHHWADGTKKSTVDKVVIASTSIGSGAATVSIVAGGVMSVASGIVGGTSAGVASGVSAAASVGITMAAVDICQFSIMLTQMNIDARPFFMENMGKKMAPAAFTFLPFGKSSSTSPDDSSSTSLGSAGLSGTSRRLATGSSANDGSSSHDSEAGTSTTGVQGMEKYAALIGVDPDMLFYLAVAGIACMVGIIFGLYATAMGVCYFIVDDFPVFSCKWLDKAIGVLMMILILSEYVVGATAMYQICYCIDHDSVDVSFFLAIFTLLGLAFGTILYGVLVIKNNEDELRDLGTKDHFDKKFHNRYGPLYDEHSFEGRFFFAPKLLLALLCGMTTGMVWIQGLWQIIVLIGLHIAFLLYLEIKQPYPTAFVQKTSSFVIIIKISALFLSFFLLSSATSFTESIPDDLREGVAFAIVGLQMLVLVCLMIRQVYIFYRTWKLKRDGASADDKTVTVQTTNAREGSEAFFALGGEPQYYSNNTNPRCGSSLVVLGDDSTPKMQDHYVQKTPSNVASTLQHNNHYRINEVDL